MLYYPQALGFSFSYAVQIKDTLGLTELYRGDVLSVEIKNSYVRNTRE